MPQVQLPESFFKKERDTIYSNWHLELFRELYQNSLDAGSTQIAVDIREQEGMTHVSFIDNGCGMTRDVLENVYFRLGETTKMSSEVGGFGRARILTNFSMDKYEIETLTNHVSGKGASYEVTDISNFPGCKQLLWTKDAQIWDLRAGHLDFISRCHFKIPVVYRGELLSRSVYLDCEEFYVRAIVDGNNAAIASLFYLPPDKAPFRGMAVVRVNGSFMFESYVGCEGLVVIELEPHISRSVLNASRNSFQGVYDRQFQEIFAEFSQNEKSASQKMFTNELRVFKGSGVFFTSKENFEKQQPVTSSKKVFSYIMASLANDLHNAKVNSVDPLYTRKERSEIIRLEGSVETGFTSYVGDWIQDTFVRVQTADEDLKRLSKSWDPSGWKFKVVGDMADFGEHAYKLSLLNVWKEALFCAMKALLEVNPSAEITWSPGFLITSNPTEAIHENDSGHHRLLLNPYNADKAIRFLLSSEESLREILAIAKHEVAHVMFGNHGENYSIIHTGMDKKVNQEECLKRMKKMRV